MASLSLVEWAQRFPLLGLGAAGFACVLVSSLVPRVRLRLSTMLEMPLPSTKQHLLPLDSIRGLAALWVAMLHGWLWTLPIFAPVKEDLEFVTVGYYGVPVFAVLSGLLIYRSLRNLRDLNHLRSYFLRRLLRVFPLYLAVSAVFLVLFPQKIGAALAEITMLRTLGYAHFLNPAAWSVYVEVLFYLIMPAIVLLGRKRPILTASALFLLFHLTEDKQSTEYLLWKYFFLGIICSEVIDKMMNTKHQRLGALIFALGSVLFALSVYSETHHGYLGFSERRLGIGIGTSLVICGAVLSPVVRAALSIRPLRILGTVSYSVYLLHPLLLFMVFGLRSGEKGLVVANGLETLQADTTTFLLIYIPAIIFYSGCTFLAVERPMLGLRPKVQQEPIQNA